VIDTGDDLYRELECPAGNDGCAGSPWGDGAASSSGAAGEEKLDPGLPVAVSAHGIE